MPVTPDWARITNTTHQQYVRKETINTLRNDKLLSLLEAKGRITFGNSGSFVQWPIEYRLIPVNPYADMNPLQYQRFNTDVTASLPWRGYSAPQAWSKMEIEKNKGIEGYVNIASTAITKLMNGMKRHFAQELYVDGESTGHEFGIHGFESFTGATQTLTAGAATPTARTANAADRAAYPNDTYAGLSTELGNKGGTWTGAYPEGYGDSQFDYFSPLLVNWSSTAWHGTNAGTWQTFGGDILRYGIMHARKNSGKDGMLDTVMMERTAYINFLNNVDDGVRITVARGADQSLLTRLGFGDVVNYEGCDVTSEFSVPSNAAFGFNADYMELKSLQNELFVLTGPNYHDQTKTWREDLDFMGNACFNPRMQVKWYSYA